MPPFTRQRGPCSASLLLTPEVFARRLHLQALMQHMSEADRHGEVLDLIGADLDASPGTRAFLAHARDLRVADNVTPGRTGRA